MATPPAPHAGSCVTAQEPCCGDTPRPAAAGRLPRHVAIIMDGNGRWAQARGLPRIEGHRRGVATVRRITEHCARLVTKRPP